MGTGQIDTLFGVDGGLGNMDYVQNELHGFEVIGDCPVLLK